MSRPRKQSTFIGQAWLVILLALVYGSGLAFVHTALSAKIAENKRNETYRVIPDLVPGAEIPMTEEVRVRGQDGRENLVYRVHDGGGVHRGWVVPAGGQGFADRIEVLIGLDPPLSTITGLYVLDQKETPGLGDYITGESFRARFRGRPTGNPLVVVKSEPRAGNEIEALTGATISSESVSSIVNMALANLRQSLRKQAPLPMSELMDTSGIGDTQE
jgi:electron transport complex protein RnfG